MDIHFIKSDSTTATFLSLILSFSFNLFNLFSISRSVSSTIGTSGKLLQSFSMSLIFLKFHCLLLFQSLPHHQTCQSFPHLTITYILAKLSFSLYSTSLGFVPSSSNMDMVWHILSKLIVIIRESFLI